MLGAEELVFPGESLEEELEDVRYLRAASEIGIGAERINVPDTT